jgi:hypothetical protein
VTDAANRILHDALKLDDHERARVAAQLLASLESSDAEVHEAWAAEVARRADDARRSDEGELDWREALEQIERSVLSR